MSRSIYFLHVDVHLLKRSTFLWPCFFWFLFYYSSAKFILIHSFLPWSHKPEIARSFLITSPFISHPVIDQVSFCNIPGKHPVLSIFVVHLSTPSATHVASSLVPSEWKLLIEFPVCTNLLLTCRTIQMKYNVFYETAFSNKLSVLLSSFYFIRWQHVKQCHGFAIFSQYLYAYLLKMKKSGHY